MKAPAPAAAEPVKDAPAFDFYPERWLVGVAPLSDAEQLAYLRLLCHQWMLQGLPPELPALRRLGGRGVTPALLEKFPAGADGRRRNPRLETVRQEQRSRIARSREKIARMNAARARRATDRIPPPVPPNTEAPASPPQTAAAAQPPVSLAQAVQAGPAMGVLPAAAEAWWLDHDARGWVDGRGQAVRNWRSSLTSYGRRWQANDQRRAAAAGSRSAKVLHAPDPDSPHGF